jgi:uncharacterized protein (TIGR04255 family)
MHYEHAPITEAVIAMGCELPDETRLEDLLKVHARLKSDYPKRADQLTVQFHLEAAAAAQGKVSPPELIGYQMASADGKQLVRLTLNEFAFSQLAPYDRWETLRAEAKRVWDTCESVLHPQRITRVGVRYINRIDIPDPNGTGIDLDVYFRTAPRIAPELPQAMKTYFVRVELPVSDPHGILIITETAVFPPSPDVVSALLDIDAVVQNVDLDIPNAWRTVEELRHKKNAAFEACITDAVRDLIK